MKEVSKSKRPKTTRDSLFPIETKNRFSTLNDEEIMDDEKFESKIETKEKGLNEKAKLKAKEFTENEQSNTKQTFEKFPSKMKIQFLKIKKSKAEVSSQKWLAKHPSVPLMQKKKYINCGKKSHCKTVPQNCKALGKICIMCRKRNHYHKGQNCKKFKKEKRKKQIDLVQGCQTLREYLGSNCCCLKTGCVQSHKSKQMEKHP